MDIETIRERLRHHTPRVVEGAEYERAAVAIVLRTGECGPEFIAIHRAHRPADPWSGHMALPGGRRHETDRDACETAIRETREEVGVDLQRTGHPFGHLDDLQAIGRGTILNLVIRPFVYGVFTAVALSPDHREVQRAFWIPLASLRSHTARGTYRFDHGGYESEHPAFLYQGYTIWGLTHRILTGFLDILG